MNKLQKSNDLYDKIAVIIEQSRQKVATAVNLTMVVYTYYEVGRYIVEDEQQGEQRAEYGKAVLKELSVRLTERFGKGFSVINLQYMRNFYSLYSAQFLKYETVSRKSQIYQTVSNKLQVSDNQTNKISQTVSGQSQKSETLSRKLQFTLSWSHYLVLMHVENPDARRFYEIEATQQQWSVRQLSRQCASSLYERLALSRDKKAVMRLANEGQTYVLIDLKTDKLKHKDLGQMQMYVNYYNRNVKQSFENPTIGIVLCETANQSLVELTLPENANIYAAQYALYLPQKEVIQQKLKEWIEEYNDENCLNP